MSVIEDPDKAHPEDKESDNPEILFEIQGGLGNGGAFETYSGPGIVEEPLHSRLLDGTEFIIGMVSPVVSTLTVEHDNGRAFEVQIFSVEDDSLPQAKYYLALLPTDTTGSLVARDRDGEVLAEVEIERWSAPECPTFSPTHSPQTAG